MSLTILIKEANMTNSSLDVLVRPLIKKAILNNYSPAEYDDVDDFVSLVQADACEIISTIDDMIDNILAQELVDLAIEIYESSYQK